VRPAWACKPGANGCLCVATFSGTRLTTRSPTSHFRQHRRSSRDLGTIRARGVELSTTARFTPHWEVSAEYLLTGSTVLKFPANRSLEGLLIPQVPRNQFNFQVNYSNAKWIVGAQGRFVGKQFDDDQNTLPLEKFFTLDAEASRSVSEHMRLFVAFQNLTGSRYQISSTPVFTVGPPVLVRVGARVSIR